MIASGGLYPSLARYFDTFTELSHAGCMSKTRMRECLDGKRDFTRSEKKSIAANIAMKELTKNPINEKELSDAVYAWQNGKFDEIYRRKEL